MADPMSYLGGQPIPESTHANSDFMLRGNVDMKTVPKADFVVKPNLPILGRDPYTREPLVIKKGTILTVETEPSTTTNKGPVLDICQSGEIPAGVAAKNYLREDYQHQVVPVAAPLRDYYIKMPYIEATNGSLTMGGWLKSGNAGVFVDWDSSADSPELAVGRLEYLDSRVDPVGWLRYVQDSMGWPVEAMFPNDILKQVSLDGSANASGGPTTASSVATISWRGTTVSVGTTPAGSLFADATNTIYYLAQDNVSLRYPVNVYVGGELLDKADEAGHWASGDGYAYRLNTREGFIEFATAQATTATVVATYWYEFDYNAGYDWEAGIVGLTDGKVSGMGPGTRPFFDVAGATGVMVIRLF
jgi:hypothetical protein